MPSTQKWNHVVVLFAMTILFSMLMLNDLSIPNCETQDISSVGSSSVRNNDADAPTRTNSTSYVSYPSKELVIMNSQQQHSNTKNNYDSNKRGIVLCLYDDIVLLGISLVMEIRCLGDYSPVEICFCTDSEMSPASRARLLEADPLIRLRDVCAAIDKRWSYQVSKFRGYYIKPLAVIKSSFDEVMLIDSDAIFIQSPQTLWSVTGYHRTGTLFFRDRIWRSNKNFLAKRVADPESDNSNKKTIPVIQYIFKKFGWEELVDFGADEKVWVNNNQSHAMPSKELQQSHAWKGNSGHYQDSSVVLFNKLVHQKALTVMEYLIHKGRFNLPKFSWGDKEIFFLSCELAQSEYFMSPWAASVIDGYMDLKEHPHSLCGSLTHYFPSELASGTRSLIYINGNSILQHEHKMNGAKVSRYNEVPSRVTVRTKKETFFGGSKIAGQCLKDIESTSLPQAAMNAIARRRAHYSSLKLNSTFALGMC